METEKRDPANQPQEVRDRKVPPELRIADGLNGEQLSELISNLTDEQLSLSIEEAEIMVSRLHVERNMRQKRDNYPEK